MILDLNESELVALRGLINRELGGGTTRPAQSGSSKPPTSKPPVSNAMFDDVPPNRSPNLRVLKVTSALTGGGYYNATQYALGTTMWTNSTNLSTTKIEGRSLGACYAVNLQEVGTSNHDLTDAANTSQKYFVGIQVGRSGDYPLFALLGNAAWFESCPDPRPGSISAGGVSSVNVNTTLDDTMYDVTVTASASAVTLTLPAATSIGNYEYWITNDSGYTLTLGPVSGTIDGAATITIADGNGKRIRSDGTAWTSTTT